MTKFSIYFMVIDLVRFFFLAFLDSILSVHIVLENYPFHLHFQVCVHKFVKCFPKVLTFIISIAKYLLFLLLFVFSFFPDYICPAYSLSNTSLLLLTK